MSTFASSGRLSCVTSQLWLATGSLLGSSGWRCDGCDERPGPCHRRGHRSELITLSDRHLARHRFLVTAEGYALVGLSL